MSDRPHYLGRYRAERVVGTGAFATVWLAHDETLGAPVAIKVLAENWAHDPEVRERFLEEARILWRADSGHIVRIHNVDELPDGRPYFVMDYADRGTLAERMADRVARGQRWSIDEAVDVSLAIASGLEVAHALGIVHRDLKPANVMFQSIAAHHGDVRDERLILTDFGIAKSLARSRGTTIATGTPHYMAPEQAEGRADERSDIYSAGVVLYELLAGRVPYPADSLARLLASQTAAPPQDIGELRDDVPVPLANALARSLAADPAERWQTVAEWAAALSAAAGRSASAAAIADPGVTMSPEALAARRAASVAAPVVGAAAAGLVAADAGGGGTPPTGPQPPSTASGDRRRRRYARIAIPAAAALIALAAVVAALTLSGTSKADASVLTLMPVSSVGANPWTASVVPKPGDTSMLNLASNPRLPRVLGAASKAKLARLVDQILHGLNPLRGAATTLKLFHLKIPPAPNGLLRPVGGAAPGLYGGTQLLSVCDKTQLTNFLDANTAKARAWAAAQGITPEQIPAYIAGLTDVVLQADTRVTNHGFLNGQANPIDEVLQAGTAVLVDAYGVPRARCYCGNPLTPPRPTTSAPTVEGVRWPGFTLQKTVVVERVTKITVIKTIDVLTGTTAVLRPVGSGPSQATINQPPAPPPVTTTTSSSSSASTTTSSASQTTSSTSSAAQTTTSSSATTGVPPDLSGSWQGVGSPASAPLWQLTASGPGLTTLHASWRGALTHSGLVGSFVGTLGRPNGVYAYTGTYDVTEAGNTGTGAMSFTVVSVNEFALAYQASNGSEVRQEFVRAANSAQTTTTQSTASTSGSAQTTTTTTAAENPAASWSPNPGPVGGNFTLSVSGFHPGVTLQLSLVRPDGSAQSYSIATNSTGAGSITFTNTQGQPTGTYTATITNSATGAHAVASVLVQPAG